MRITGSGQSLAPWRRRVLPVLMGALRALVAWVVLRPWIEFLLATPTFLANLGPHWLRYPLAALLALGAVLFIWSRTVVLGALLAGTGLCLFEFVWRRVAPVPHDAAFVHALGLLAVLAAAESLVRFVQRRVYRPD